MRIVDVYFIIKNKLSNTLLQYKYFLILFSVTYVMFACILIVVLSLASHVCKLLLATKSVTANQSITAFLQITAAPGLTYCSFPIVYWVGVCNMFYALYVYICLVSMYSIDRCIH